MLRISLAFVALLGLVACGGGSSSSSNRGYTSVQFASGPIQQACQRQGRKAASRARCGCVQSVANRELSASDQRRGASYFKKPGRLQEVRQSDTASNERFWRAWKAYGQKAAKVCAGT